MTWKKRFALGAYAAIVVAIAGACADQVRRSEAPTEPVVLPGAQYVGTEKCLMCHEDQAAKLEGSRHWIEAVEGSPMDTHGCESCHGPGSKHLEMQMEDEEAEEGAERSVLLYVFGTDSPMPARQQNEACLECHRDTHRDWEASPHAAADLSCTACHEVHGGQMPAAYEGKSKVNCAKCHQDVQAEFRLAHHHPVPEGRMECTGCHDPHGRSIHEYSVNQLNETCYQCHTEIRGPWVFEHAATREGCTVCHSPHGTSSIRLLRERDFNLCNRCHYQAEYYQSTGHYSHRRAKNMTVEPFGEKYAKCYDCHRAIHGSNFSKEFRVK